MKFSLYGRTFAVLAVFPDTDEGADAANAYMARADKGPHEGPAVLATHEGEIIIADYNDKGVGTDSVDDNPHWVER